MDEACALIKTELDSMPSELDEQRRKIMQLEIEESALKKETDNLSKERLEALQKELAELRDTFNTQKAQWDNEKHSVEKLQKLREQIEDVNKQIQQIQEMIDEGVDAVFLAPVDWEAIKPALEALDEADIPVINVDTQVKDTDLTAAYIGSDNKNAGAVCGENLKTQCPDGGKVVLLECPSQNSVNERITGFEEAIKNAGFEVVARADAGGTKESAKEKMAQILAENPQVDAVMCGNDQMALGALQAAKEAGKSSLKIYGVDGSPEMKSELTDEKSMIAGTGAQSPINVGKQAAKIGEAILNDEDYEKTTYIDTFFIGKDNVEMYGTNGWQ